MMKKAFSLIVVVLLVVGCKSNSTPKSASGYFFDYRVSISNSITEPTIINGYWGYVKEYKGNFMPDPSAVEQKQPKVATNRILFFEANWKEAIEETALVKNGVKFYNLNEIKKENIAPKVTMYPNREGFYQFDPNGKSYVALIQVSKKLGYMNGGLQEFTEQNNQLVEFEMRIDYDASF